MILFSKRKELAERAVEWCKENNVPIVPLNIVGALNAIGALKIPEKDQEKSKL